MDLSSQQTDNGPQFTTFRQWTSVHNIQTMDLSSQHSDNGPQFTTYRKWTSVHNIQTMGLSSNWEFEHTTSSPYHSQSNGKAESSVKRAKQMLKRAADPQLALLECRNTITAGMTTSPIQRLFNISTRSTLPQRECVSAEVKVNCAEKKGNNVKRSTTTTRERETKIKEGTSVLLWDFTSHEQKWKDAQVLKQLTDRSFSVVSQGHVLRRTRRHLIPHVVPEDVDRPTTGVVPQAVPVDVYHPTASLPPQANPVEVDNQSVNIDPQDQVTVTTKSGRLVKKPVWYED